MKKVFLSLLAAGLLTACSNDDNAFNGTPVEETEMVTLNFSPYEQEAMTRAATSISGIVTQLDVWIYESGNEVAAVHQSSSDADFGSVSVELNKTKTYTIYAIGHKAAGAATLADGIIAFPDEKVSHAMFYTTTFTPATTTNINAVMTRIVCMFRFELADQVPDEAYTMQIAIPSTFTRWNVNNTGTNAVDRTATFENFSRNANGTAVFNIYIIPPNLTVTDNIDITVTALRSDNSVIETKTFEDVPIKAGYKTTYHGNFFVTTSTAATFQVDDWSEFDTIEF